MKIAQVGSFDVENFGDLLFPDVLDFVVTKGTKIDLFSPVGGVKCFDTKVVYSLKDFEKILNEYKKLEEKYCDINNE